MNSDVLKGKWQQVKGKVKQQWGKLTDDDMRQIEGNLDAATGRIQERYGYTRERAKKEWDEFCTKHGDASKSAGEV